MLSDEDLKCLEGHAMVGGVLGPWRDMLDLIDEVRRLRGLVEAATEFHFDRYVVAPAWGSWTVRDQRNLHQAGVTFGTRDEALAYARERSRR